MKAIDYQTLKRYENFIQKLESYPVRREQVLLYGSSFFTNWGYEKAQNDLSFEKISVINHGFGGAVLDDLLYYYGRLVKPYSPKAVIIRSGVNDIASGFEAEEAFFLLTRLCGWILADFPDIQVGIMPFFDVPKHEWVGIRDKFAEFNRLCREYAAQNEQVFILDITDLVYENPEDAGTYQNFRDIFLEDGLHLTVEGYNLVGPAIKERLKKALDIV